MKMTGHVISARAAQSFALRLLPHPEAQQSPEIESVLASFAIPAYSL